MELLGRKVIKIPVSKVEFNKNPKKFLEKYLSTAIDEHRENVNEIQYIHNQYLGKQDILTTKKRYDNSNINNQIVENHIYKQVGFKVGFMYGNPLEYTIINEQKIETDDLTYLNAYLGDVDKASLDIEKAQDIYEFGIAYQRIIPKRTKIEDLDSESPFELVNMPIEKTCVVYSNDIPSEKLFGMVLNQKLNDDGQTEDFFQIFMPHKKYELDKEYKVVDIKTQPYNYIPIVEFCLNKDRIGIVEVVLGLQDLLNKINSSQMDDIEENVNAFLVLFNQKTDEEFLETFRKLRKEKVLVLNTNNPQVPADVRMISSELDQSNVNIFYERVKKAMYDINSVPQASGNVTSGGDTGQARLLGNGWESAENQAQVDQTYLTRFERELIKNMIWICKNTEGCPLNEISASDIAIKFNINMSNNLLVKAEALELLDRCNFPEKLNLTVCGITKDVDGFGKAWKENKERVKKENEKFVEKQIEGKDNEPKPNKNKVTNNTEK